MKKHLKNLGINVLILAAIVIVLASAICLVWNVGIVWLLPQSGSMSYLTAIGFSIMYVLIHMFTNYWVQRFIAAKTAKSLEALLLVESLEKDIISLNSQITSLKMELRYKNIL
jgi:hypothetical protein